MKNEAFASIPVKSGRKRILKTEMDFLWVHYRLLHDRKDARRFRLFLDADYFGKDKRFAAVHGKLYPKFLTGGKFYRAGVLFRNIGLTGSEEENIGPAAAFLRDLAGRIRDYRMYESLKERKALREMITVEAIKGKGHRLVYRDVLRRWARDIERMPIGTWRLFQSWRQADAIHFDPDRNQQRTKHGNLPATKQTFDLFTRFYRAFYRCEAEGRTDIIDHEPEYVRSEVTRENTLLVNIYEGILDLRTGRRLNPERYEEIKRLYLDHDTRIDDYHRYAIFLHLTNYLTLCRRQKWMDTNKESNFWLRYLLEDGLVVRKGAVGARFFTNRVSEAFILRDFDLAETVRGELSPFLDGEERAMVNFLYQAQSLFYRDFFPEMLRFLSTEAGEVEVEGHQYHIWYKSLQIRGELVAALQSADETGALKRQIKNLRRLINSPASEMSTDRFDETNNFLDLTEEIYRAERNDELRERCYELLADIRDKKVLHARKWLFCLVAHFDPTLRPRPDILLPTGNENEPWASLKRHLP